MKEFEPLTPKGNRPLVTPIVTSVNYEYGSFEVLERISSGDLEGYTYNRDDNPTVRALERKVASLEGAEHCLLASSGMAALTMIYLTFLKPEDRFIIFHDTYGANYKVSLILERFGVEVAWLDAADYEKVAEVNDERTAMILCETPSNPLCKVVDIAHLKKEAERAGALLVVDSTFATPHHQRPLEHGADLVVHSATKGLGGHSDLMAGVVACSSKELHEALWYTRQAVGAVLDPHPANLLERGLKTLEIRAARMAENAQAMAEFLSSHPKITRILYAGLPEDPGHEVAKRQMKNGFGGLLAFDVGESQEEAKRFVKKLNSITHAVSLGSVETLVCLPILSTMLYLPEERRVTFGVKPNTVRISAGVEPTEELIADLKQALE